MPDYTKDINRNKYDRHGIKKMSSDDSGSDDTGQESSKPDTTKPESSKPDTTKPESSKPDTTKPESSKPDTTKPESSKPDTTKPESSKPDTTKPESSKPDTTKPESSKPDTTKPESDSLESNQKISVKKSTFNVLIIGIIILVGATSFLAGSYTSSLNSEQISTEDLEEALAKLELKLLQNQLPTNQPAPQAVRPDPVRISIDDDPVIGNPNAPITIIEFSDFQCPFCARFHVQTLPLIFEEYIQQGKVKLVYRDFPIQSSHPNALPAAIAAECANDQDGFTGMHNVLFERQNEWSRLNTADALSLFSQYAKDLQLEQTTFNSCLSDEGHVAEINRDLEDARNYGVTGTPGFFIGNDHLGYVELKGAQPFESFKRIIDAQLEA